MLLRALLTSALTLLLTLSGTGAVASVTETRQFRGEGSSDFGLALYYARYDARRQAENAGFSADNCQEIATYVWPYTATVIWECTR